MKMVQLRKTVLDRLPHYYRFLRERLARDCGNAVSSSQIAEFVGLDDTQVRKDLAAIGLRGIPRVGFDAKNVVNTIHQVLGFDQTYPTIIIGAGRLGGALACYGGFSHYGMNVVAVFDMDERVIGTDIGGFIVRDAALIEETIKKSTVRLAILTVPAEVAQALTDRLIAAGINALWNFAPTNIMVPSGITVRNEHLSVALAELAYHMKERTV